MVGWHHRLNGHGFVQTPGGGEGQGSLTCCSPWGCKELDMTEQLNKQYNMMIIYPIYHSIYNIVNIYISENDYHKKFSSCASSHTVTTVFLVKELLRPTLVATLWTFLVAQMVKNLSAMWETQVRSLGQKDPLQKGMATHFNILACRIPRTEESGGLQSTGSQRVRQNWDFQIYDTFSLAA